MDPRQPRKFTLWTLLTMVGFASLAIVTLPLWIVPAIQAFRNTSD